MVRKFLLASAALALVATAADARPQVTVSPDNRFVSVLPGNGSLHVFGAKRPKSHTYAWTNLATDYPDGLYFCCYGSTVSGPSSFLGAAYGVAVQFELKKKGKITELTSDVGYVSGTHSVTLTLYADNGNNSPGAVKATGTATSSTAFGDCCGVATATIASTNLAAGTPYWVAVTASGSDFDAAGFETSDEVDDFYRAYTSNGGTTWGSGINEANFLPAFGVGP